METKVSANGSVNESTRYSCWLSGKVTANERIYLTATQPEQRSLIVLVVLAGNCGF
jgi:hypothetical protein